MDTTKKVNSNRACKHCGCEIIDHYKDKPWSCKPCIKIQAKKWREANPDKCKAHQKNKNPEDKYFWNAKRLYGVSKEEYQLLLDKQGNCCAICKTTEPGNSIGPHNRFSIDHDHETGRVRGLLCNNCNRGIGLLKDSPTVLLQAHAYLTKK